MMRRPLFTLLLLVFTGAHAHVQLSEPILKTAIDDVQRLQKGVDNNDDKKVTAATHFEIASIATEIVALMNADVVAHNTTQDELLSESVRRVNAIGLGIAWSDEHKRYFYDGAGYQEYLRLLPDGIRAADSLFHILERSYYLYDNVDTVALETRAAEKFGFLRRFPDYGEAAKIRIFLSIDYRDLSRFCRERREKQCETKFSELAREQLQMIIDDSPDGPHAAVAVGLLNRFEQEIAHSLQEY
ncbi:MAG: hypothetical protein HKN77_04505 [Woeseiaceae bacterium]|nr:hypothetical protein [Woeseiaceae bacterium]